ncbi:MAG: hypothetical protein Q4B63_00255 [Clostridium perfringens]|nr:hypothetical protein [Clostridium perfringens]
MIYVFLENDRRGNIIFKAKIDEYIKENKMIKRILMESKFLKKESLYNIPMKFLLPLLNNFPKEHLKIDSKSLNTFLEFSDEYDENFYYIYKANSRYMNKWIENGCPKIYKTIINKEDLSISKSVAFERNL